MPICSRSRLLELLGSQGVPANSAQKPLFEWLEIEFIHVAASHILSLDTYKNGLNILGMAGDETTDEFEPRKLTDAE